MEKNEKISEKRIKGELSKTEKYEISLEERIAEVSEGLFYISETDSEIVPFVGENYKAEKYDEFLKRTTGKKDEVIEVRDTDYFFERLTRIQDWHRADETERVNKFTDLKKFLEDNLSDLKVVRIGTIQIDIYVVGLDQENRLVGIRTFGVET